MKNTLLGLAVTAAMSQIPAASMAAQQVYSNTNRIQQLCSDPDIVAKIAHPEDVCEVSTDGGQTWIWISRAALAILIAGGTIFTLRRPKKATTSTDSGTTSETGKEESRGESAKHSNPTGTNSSSESDTNPGPEEGPKTDSSTTGTNPGSKERAETETNSSEGSTKTAGAGPKFDSSIKSVFESIPGDFSYSEADQANAKLLIRRLISKHKAGHGGKPSALETENSKFLNMLNSALRGGNRSLSSVDSIQKIFAIARFENLANIPSPSSV